MSNQAIQQLQGILPALVTPLDRDGNVDAAGARRLAGYVEDGGVSGILVLGSTGEGATLGERQRRDLTRILAEHLNSRLPLLVGVAQVNPAAAEEEVKAAAALGANAALVTLPFYNPLDQAGVLTFYRRLAGASPIPILVYNIPSYTKISVEPPTLATLFNEGAIAGVKDSSGNFGYHTRLLDTARSLPGFRVFMGNEMMLLPSLSMGSAGTICATANVAPRVLVRLFEAFQRSDILAAREAEFEVVDICSRLISAGLPAGFKMALHLMGLIEPWVAPPLSVSEGREPAIRAALEQHRLPLAAAVAA